MSFDIRIKNGDLLIINCSDNSFCLWCININTIEYSKLYIFVHLDNWSSGASLSLIFSESSSLSSDYSCLKIIHPLLYIRIWLVDYVHIARARQHRRALEFHTARLFNLAQKWITSKVDTACRSSLIGSYTPIQSAPVLVFFQRGILSSVYVQIIFSQDKHGR